MDIEEKAENVAYKKGPGKWVRCEVYTVGDCVEKAVWYGDKNEVKQCETFATDGRGGNPQLFRIAYWPFHALNTPPTPDSYATLRDVLGRAFAQGTAGKGKERHATNLPFDRQPMVTGARDYGPGGPLFQVGKKSREAFGMIQRGERDKAVHELLGAIVYAAGAIVAIESDD